MRAYTELYMKKPYFRLKSNRGVTAHAPIGGRIGGRSGFNVAKSGKQVIKNNVNTRRVDNVYTTYKPYNLYDPIIVTPSPSDNIYDTFGLGGFLFVFYFAIFCIAFLNLIMSLQKPKK